MRLSVYSRFPDDMLTAGELLTWLDAVVRVYGDDLPLTLRTKDGTEMPCLDAFIQDKRSIVFDTKRRVRVCFGA